MVKILFLIKNGKKSRHGCVKSEHVLYFVNISWHQNLDQLKSRVCYLQPSLFLLIIPSIPDHIWCVSVGGRRVHVDGLDRADCDLALRKDI